METMSPLARVTQWCPREIMENSILSEFALRPVNGDIQA